MPIRFLEKELRLRHRREAEPMQRTGAVLAQGTKVLGRGVAFVMAESVVRIEEIDFRHDLVASHLRDDTGRSDGEASSITPYDGGVRGGKISHGKAIDQYVVGLQGKFANRLPHGLVRGSQNVQRIDRRHVLNGDSPANMGRTGDSLKELAPEFRGQFF